MAPDSLRVVEGEEHLRAWEPEGGFAKVFCVECGSALFGRAPGSDEISLVQDGRDRRRPRAFGMQGRQFVANAAVWEPIPDDGLPRFDGPFPGT